MTLTLGPIFAQSLHNFAISIKNASFDYRGSRSRGFDDSFLFPYYANEHKFACIRGHDFNLGLSTKEEPAPVKRAIILPILHGVH